MSQVEVHTIPENKLRGFRVNNRVGVTEKDIEINGIKVDNEHVLGIDYYNIGEGTYVLMIVGYLDRLSKEAKESWGIIKEEK